MEASSEIRLGPPGPVLRNGCGFVAASSPQHGKYPKINNTARQELQTNLYDDVMETFNKCFFYQNQKDHHWNLPPVDVLFTEYYQVDSLQQLKVRLNDVKSKLNDYVIEAWSRHTSRKDPAGEIPWRLKSKTNAEFVTIAWCKFFECLNRFPSLLVNGGQLNSLHLCEAPGAFIAALNHYLYSRYEKEEVSIKVVSLLDS